MRAIDGERSPASLAGRADKGGCVQSDKVNAKSVGTGFDNGRRQSQITHWKGGGLKRSEQDKTGLWEEMPEEEAVVTQGEGETGQRARGIA